jgi:hypothetical protein
VAAESTAAGSSTEQLAFDRALFDATDEALSAIYAEVRLLIICIFVETDTSLFVGSLRFG